MSETIRYVSVYVPPRGDEVMDVLVAVPGFTGNEQVVIVEGIPGIKFLGDNGKIVITTGDNPVMVQATDRAAGRPIRCAVPLDDPGESVQIFLSERFGEVSIRSRSGLPASFIVVEQR